MAWWPLAEASKRAAPGDTLKELSVGRPQIGWKVAVCLICYSYDFHYYYFIYLCIYLFMYLLIYVFIHLLFSDRVFSHEKDDDFP